MTSREEKTRWADIAEQASKETDPKKLSALVEQLYASIDNKSQANNDAADFPFDA